MKSERSSNLSGSVWSKPSAIPAPCSDQGVTSKNQHGKKVDAAMSSRHNLTLGIDFGTSNSCAAIWNPVKNKAKVIKIDKRLKGMFSYLFFGHVLYELKLL